MSHITKIKTRLDDINSVKQFIESKRMKELGFEFVTKGEVRYWNGNKSKADYVIRCPGKYDIGINETKDGLELAADWSYADFYSAIGLKTRSQEAVESFLNMGQNQMKFTNKMTNEGYIVTDVVDKLTGKVKVEAVKY